MKIIRIEFRVNNLLEVSKILLWLCRRILILFFIHFIFHRYRPSLQPTVIKLQIGDIIDNSGIFPIVIDVPDTISTIFNGISTIVTAVGQRIPIVQGFFRPEQPRNPSNITIKKPIVRDEYLYYFSVNNEVMGDKKMLLVPILQQKITIVDLREKTMEHNKAKV